MVRRRTHTPRPYPWGAEKRGVRSRPSLASAYRVVARDSHFAPPPQPPATFPRTDRPPPGPAARDATLRVVAHCPHAAPRHNRQPSRSLLTPASPVPPPRQATLRVVAHYPHAAPHRNRQPSRFLLTPISPVQPPRHTTHRVVAHYRHSASHRNRQRALPDQSPPAHPNHAPKISRQCGAIRRAQPCRSGEPSPAPAQPPGPPPIGSLRTTRTPPHATTASHILPDESPPGRPEPRAMNLATMRRREAPVPRSSNPSQATPAPAASRCRGSLQPTPDSAHGDRRDDTLWRNAESPPGRAPSIVTAAARCLTGSCPAATNTVCEVWRTRRSSGGIQDPAGLPVSETILHQDAPSALRKPLTRRSHAPVLPCGNGESEPGTFPCSRTPLHSEGGKTRQVARMQATA